MSLPSFSFEDVARLSTFLGLVRLLELRSRYPGAPDHELIGAAAVGTADQTAADVITASKLIDVLQLDELQADASSMRLFLSRLLEQEQPPWIMAAVRGRKALQSAMSAAAAQCFSFAQLFDSAPNVEVVLWWDRLAEIQRSGERHILKDRGREGERLSIEYETRRLADLGLNQQPKWVALDDEWLGYDILSYDVRPDGLVTNRLIEVKACSALPLQIFLTKNEWDRAVQANDAHVFHVWHLPSQKLIQLNWQSLSGHIPVDKGNGAWQEVRIRLHITLCAYE